MGFGGSLITELPHCAALLDPPCLFPRHRSIIAACWGHALPSNVAARSVCSGPASHPNRFSPVNSYLLPDTERACRRGCLAHADLILNRSWCALSMLSAFLNSRPFFIISSNQCEKKLPLSGCFWLALPMHMHVTFTFLSAPHQASEVCVPLWCLFCRLRGESDEEVKKVMWFKGTAPVGLCFGVVETIAIRKALQPNPAPPQINLHEKGDHGVLIHSWPSPPPLSLKLIKMAPDSPISLAGSHPLSVRDTKPADSEPLAHRIVCVALGRELSHNCFSALRISLTGMSSEAPLEQHGSNHSHTINIRNGRRPVSAEKLQRCLCGSL